MDTTKLIDAIALADKADFDNLQNKKARFVGAVGEAAAKLYDIGVIVHHAARVDSCFDPSTFLESLFAMTTEAKDGLIKAYPEVKDLLSSPPPGPIVTENHVSNGTD